MICSICKRNDVRPPTCCDKCGALACEDCMTSGLPPGTWEIKFNWDLETGKVSICKNCMAEHTLTED